MSDGGHEERSASYHFLILDRLLELACVMELLDEKIPNWLLKSLKKMYEWSEKVVIAKNVIPRFNDSPVDGCYQIKNILYFARSFFGDIKPNKLDLDLPYYKNTISKC